MTASPQQNASPSARRKSMIFKWSFLGGLILGLVFAVFGVTVVVCNYFVTDSLLGQIVVTVTLTLYPFAFVWFAFLFVNMALRQLAGHFFGEFAFGAWVAVLLTVSIALIAGLFGYATYALHTWPQQSAKVLPFATSGLGVLLGVITSFVVGANKTETWIGIIAGYVTIFGTFGAAIAALFPSQ